MKAMFALAVASICMLAGQSQSQEKKAEKATGDWTSHTVKAGNYKIKMPVKETKEQIIELPIGGEKINLYIFGAETETTAYLVGYCDYPKDLVEKGDVDAMLDGVVKGMLDGMGGKEKKTDKIKVEGFNAREVEFAILKNKAIGKARCFLKGNRLYQIIAFEVNEKPQYVDDFVQSFELVKAEKK